MENESPASGKGTQVALRIIQQALQKRFKNDRGDAHAHQSKHFQRDLGRSFYSQLTQEDMTKLYAAKKPRLDHDLQTRLDICRTL
jgi:hypothetical protein